MMNNHAKDFGIKVEGLEFDFGKIIKRSRNVSTKITRGVEFLMKKNNVERIKGFGKFVSPKELQIFDDDRNETERITADKIIIATGAKPKMVPAIPVDYQNIITSTQAMTLDKLPESLVVIGAGAIGIEFAYFYSVLGTKVTIIEMMDSVLPVEDKEVSGALEMSLRKRKIDIHTSTMVESAKVAENEVVVTIVKNGEKQEIRAEKVLNAIGVTGNIEGYGLREIGVETERSSIIVDKDTYQTNIEGVYAVGDVIGAPGWLMLPRPKQYTALRK